MEDVGTTVLDHPLPSPATLAPPVEWGRLPTVEPDELVKRLTVGGLIDVPVRW